MFCAKCGGRNDQDARFCLHCGSALLKLERAAGQTAKRHWLAVPAAPKLARPRLPNLAFDPRTDWRAWRRQLFGLQGILLLLCLGLALGLNALEPYLFAPSPDPEIADRVEQGTIASVLLRRAEAQPQGDTPASFSLRALAEAGAELDGKAVRVTADLIRHGVDWNDNHLLVLKESGTEIRAVYVGYLGNLYPGEKAELEGTWRAEVGAIDASSVRSLSLRAALREDPATMSVAATVARGLNVVLPLLSLLILATRWFVTRPGRRSSPGIAGRVAITGLLLAAVALFGTGCRVQQLVTVYQNGSGQVVTTFQFDTSQMNQLRGSPNMDSYLTSLRDNIEARGAKVYNYSRGTAEYIVIERPFSSLEELNSWEGDLTLGISDSGRDVVYDYRVTLDPLKLYPVPGEQGASQVSAELNKMEWEHRVVLPGRVVSTTPQPREQIVNDGSMEAVFRIPMKGATALRYVTQQVDRGAAQDAERRLEANIALQRQMVESVQYTSLASAVILAAALLLFRPARREEAL